MRANMAVSMWKMVISGDDVVVVVVSLFVLIFAAIVL